MAKHRGGQKEGDTNLRMQPQKITPYRSLNITDAAYTLVLGHTSTVETYINT